MTKASKTQRVTITSENPMTNVILLGQNLTQIGRVYCDSGTAVNTVTLNEMLMAQAELDRQSSESIMQLVDHIDDILRMWFANPVIARNNLKHVADCLDEISQAFSEKSCKLYEYINLDAKEE